MSVSAAASPSWLTALLEGGRALPASPAAWLNSRRAAALERTNALTVPTSSDEEWRFTDLSPLRKFSYQAVSPGAVSADEISGFVIPDRKSTRLNSIHT